MTSHASCDVAFGRNPRDSATEITEGTEERHNIMIFEFSVLSVSSKEGDCWGFPRLVLKDDGNLTPDRIRSILVGINPPTHSSVKMLIRDLAWVKF